jgi:hypothetical protein
MGSRAMKQTTPKQTPFNEFSQPWRKFPQILGFYAAMWVVGAVVLTAVHVWFPPEKATSRSMPPVEAPKIPVEGPVNVAPVGPIAPMAMGNPSAQAISKAWDEVRSTDDIVQLTDFATKFPGSPFAELAWKRINELVEAGGLKLASLDDNASFVALVLSHQKEASRVLDQLIDDHDLKNKYPLGFAIFYADGSKVLNYGTRGQSGKISFDPSDMKVSFRGDKAVCVDQLPVRMDGILVSNFSNVCFGGNGSIIRAVKYANLAEIDIEPVGQSSEGLAWVIGMRPV